MRVVYIVEDLSSIALRMADVVRGLGCAVEVFADGLEAYARILEQPPALLLLDVMLPSLDGLALARLVKFNETTSHVPVLMISSVSDDVAEMARASRVEAILAKPFDVDDMTAEVARMLALEVA
ncbi:MAG: response regulator [Proteobacteria bacterium]|nr:response regulator [Pseudomonadota bacterium]